MDSEKTRKYLGTLDGDNAAEDGILNGLFGRRGKGDGEKKCSPKNPSECPYHGKKIRQAEHLITRIEHGDDENELN